jgi:hypothetical protein
MFHNIQFIFTYRVAAAVVFDISRMETFQLVHKVSAFACNFSTSVMCVRLLFLRHFYMFIIFCHCIIGKRKIKLLQLQLSEFRDNFFMANL